MACFSLEIITPFAVICQVKALCLFFIVYSKADNGLDNFNDDVTAMPAHTMVTTVAKSWATKALLTHPPPVLHR